MRKLIALLCVLTLAAVAAGCGSSGGSDGSDDGSTTTSAEETTTTTGGAAVADDDAYLDAIAAHLTSGSEEDLDLVIADGEGACVAPVWLETITAQAIADAGATAEDVADPGFSWKDLGLDEEQAQAMIDAFEPCGVDIYGELGNSFTQGLSEEQQSCAVEEIDPEAANALLLTAFSEDAGSGDEEISALIDQLTEACDLPAS